MGLLARKSIAQLRADAERSGLPRTLELADLLVLGVGATIGAGIFVVTGWVAAESAGPAIVLSFLLAGAVCLLAGLCYAELASMIPVAGSTYTYAYATAGEIFAWLVGWAALLEYLLGSAVVAIGWSGYLASFASHPGVALPTGGRVNVAAMAVVLLLTGVLTLGVRPSTYATGVLVLVKVGVIVLFLAFGAAFVEPRNWVPFVPPNRGAFGEFGWSGVLRGAGLLFFAYIGFDAVSTAAQEARDPDRDLPRGILGSIVICALLYTAVAGVLTGLVPYPRLRAPMPFAVAAEAIGLPWLGFWIELGALAGLTSVLLVLLLGQARVVFAMSRDGLLPRLLGRVHPRFRAPHLATLATGGVTTLAAGFLPLSLVGEMVSVGTLVSFATVCVLVLVLRRTAPEAARPFRAPAAPWLPLLGALSCLYMLAAMPAAVWPASAAWFAVALLVYLAARLRR